MNLDGSVRIDQEIDEKEVVSLPDRWILRELNQTIRKVYQSLEGYKFNEASHALYQFVWHQFCDWYLELIKPFLYQEEDVGRKKVTQQTLLHTLDRTLRMLHPFMPFVTEEIWQQLPNQRKDGSIMITPFPKPDSRFDAPEVTEEMGWVIEIITALRNIRGEMNVPPGDQVIVLVRTKEMEVEKGIEKNQSFIKNLARVKELTVGRNIEKPLYSAFAAVRGTEIFVPMDRSRMEEEGKRLQKEIIKIEKEMAFVTQKLSNDQFLSKAPPGVVEEVRGKAKEMQALRDKLEESLKKIKEVLD
jgi:valyl-tRNA synthetase